MGLLACTQQETEEGLQQAVLGGPEENYTETNFEEPVMFRERFQLPKTLSE